MSESPEPDTPLDPAATYKSRSISFLRPPQQHKQQQQNDPRDQQELNYIYIGKHHTSPTVFAGDAVSGFVNPRSLPQKSQQDSTTSDILLNTDCDNQITWSFQ
jgi:hypothetical protein